MNCEIFGKARGNYIKAAEEDPRERKNLDLNLDPESFGKWDADHRRGFINWRRDQGKRVECLVSRHKLMQGLASGKDTMVKGFTGSGKSFSICEHAEAITKATMGVTVWILPHRNGVDACNQIVKKVRILPEEYAVRHGEA